MEFDLTQEGFSKALNYFNELIASNEYSYLRLVCSKHPYSEGYWIEYDNNEISDEYYDRIVFEYDNRANFRDKRIDEILNDD
jgi:hypothetical protein